MPERCGGYGGQCMLRCDEVSERRRAGGGAAPGAVRRRAGGDMLETKRHEEPCRVGATWVSAGGEMLEEGGRLGWLNGGCAMSN